MKLNTILYNQELKNEWDKFVDNSKNGTFMLKRDYMDYHSDRFQDFSLMFYEDNKLIAVMPASVHGDEVRSHGGLTYGGIISNRKMTSPKMLEVFDSQLAQFGLIIQQKRKKTIFEFNEIFGRVFEQITGINGVTISYHPSWKNDDGNIDFDYILKYLKQNSQKDQTFETTLSGPHRDRIDFVLNHHLFVPTASTGQCRLISLLLRVAQAIFYSRAVGKNPVLLMDDVLLELDPNKRAKITAMLPEYEQLFCTFLPGEPYERYKKEETKIYKISEGGWYE